MSGSLSCLRQIPVRLAPLLASLLVALWASACARHPLALESVPSGVPPVTTVAFEPTNTPQATLPPVALAAPATPTTAPTATPSPMPTVEPTATTLLSLPYLVVVDAGHGGIDLGARRFDAQGRMVYHESQVTLELALLVRSELERRGLQVLLTREGDYEVNAEGRDVNGDGIVDYTVDESQARVDLANAAGADVLLSLHLNAFQYPDGRPAPHVGGAQTFYCGDRSFAADNRRLAELVHAAVLAAMHDLDYPIQDRGVQDDGHLVTPDSQGKHIILLGPQSERIVRPSQMPGVLSEPLFITHEIEGEMARDPLVLARLAEAYADAVLAFLLGQDPGR